MNLVQNLSQKLKHLPLQNNSLFATPEDRGSKFFNGVSLKPPSKTITNYPEYNPQ